MDFFALGTPVIDEFARVDGKGLAKLGLKKGATNYFSAAKLASIERLLSKKITYRYPGDNARNVCEGFAALGGFCGFAGAVGSDKAGAEFEANLLECGIAPFLQEKKGSTGKILALVTPDGQRTFAADLGVSGDCDEFDALALSESRMFYASSITLLVKPVCSLAIRYLDEAKKRKKNITIAIENPPMVETNSKKLIALVKKYADFVFLNEDEANALFGTRAVEKAGRKKSGKISNSLLEKKLALLKPSALIYLKKGEKGSFLFHKGRKWHVPALKANAIDTTGAGDAYAAGTLYGLSRGYSPLGSAKIGCMLATKVVQKIGAGIPMRHTRLKTRHMH